MRQVALVVVVKEIVILETLRAETRNTVRLNGGSSTFKLLMAKKHYCSEITGVD